LFYNLTLFCLLHVMIHYHITAVVPKVTTDLDKHTLVVDLAVSFIPAAIQTACFIALTLILLVSHTSVFCSAGMHIYMMVNLTSLKEVGVFASIPSISKTLKHHLLIIRKNTRPAFLASLFVKKHLITAALALPDIAGSQFAQAVVPCADAASELPNPLISLTLEPGMLVSIFVNAVYVFDDRLVVVYNFKENARTAELVEVMCAFGGGSDIACFAPPKSFYLTTKGLFHL